MKTDEKTLDSPKQEMPLKRVTLLVDALFCFLFLPSLLYFASILGWLQMYPSYSCVLIAYSYAIYFVVRKINIPRLFINKKYWQIVSVLILFWLITELLTRYPHESDEVMDAFPNTKGLDALACRVRLWPFCLADIGTDASGGEEAQARGTENQGGTRSLQSSD